MYLKGCLKAALYNIKIKPLSKLGKRRLHFIARPLQTISGDFRPLRSDSFWMVLNAIAILYAENDSLQLEMSESPELIKARKAALKDIISEIWFDSDVHPAIFELIAEMAGDMEVVEEKKRVKDEYIRVRTSSFDASTGAYFFSNRSRY